MDDSEDLRRKAAQYAEMAAEARDPDVRASLLALAAEFEAEAGAASSARPTPPNPAA